MVDSADLGFYGAAWRFTDFCQHLYARSVYLQLVLKSCELPGVFLLHDLRPACSAVCEIAKAIDMIEKAATTANASPGRPMPLKSAFPL